VPADPGFASRPAVARPLLERRVAATLQLARVGGDTLYGADRPLCQWREAPPA